MKNEKVVLQLIEDSISENLNKIILLQTDEDELYAININAMARKLATPILTIIINIGCNLVTPYISGYIHNVQAIQSEEHIVINYEQSKFIFESAINQVRDEQIDKEKLLAIFDDEYRKINTCTHK